MSRKHRVSATLRRALAHENARYAAALVEIPRAAWPQGQHDQRRVKVWRNDRYLVQAFVEPGAVRLSVNRTTIDDAGRWSDRITWEQLQKIKRLCGYGERFAVEIYPADRDLVDVANMRHLWILDEPPPIGWRCDDDSND